VDDKIAAVFDLVDLGNLFFDIFKVVDQVFEQARAFDQVCAGFFKIVVKLYFSRKERNFQLASLN